MNQNLGAAALAKQRNLQALIETLNNTTIGSLNQDIQDNQTSISEAKAQIVIMQNNISAIASVFGIAFNQDGTLASEQYSSHTHMYNDSTIEDTEDGAGTSSTTEKITQGVS